MICVCGVELSRHVKALLELTGGWGMGGRVPLAPSCEFTLLTV